MRNHLEKNAKGTTEKKHQRRNTNEKEKEEEERGYGMNTIYHQRVGKMEAIRIDSFCRKKRVPKETLWNIENSQEDDENMICFKNFVQNDLSDDNVNGRGDIVFDHFGNAQRRNSRWDIRSQSGSRNESWNGSEKRSKVRRKSMRDKLIIFNNKGQSRNPPRDHKHNSITGLNLTNYMMVPDDIRHKYTKTYLFQISKRLLVMKKPWRLPKNVELQINNVYHLSNYIKVLERISNEYLNDPPINYYYKGLELYNKNVFANIDYLLKKVDIKKNPKNFQYRNLIKVNECYYDLSTFGKSPSAMLYQSYVIWDVHGSSLTLEQEYENFFNSQIMDYSFGEKEYPSLKYILSICSSILFWLNFNKKDNFAIINYHKISSFILLIFSCVMLVIDNTLTFSQIQEILYKSSKISNSDKEDVEDSVDTNISSNYFGNKYDTVSNEEESDDTYNLLARGEAESGGHSRISLDNRMTNLQRDKYEGSGSIYDNEEDSDPRSKNYKDKSLENDSYTKKRETSDSLDDIYHFGNCNSEDYPTTYDNHFKGGNITFTRNGYKSSKPVSNLSKMQYHTLNLNGRKSVEYDNEMDSSQKKKKTKFSNSWGFDLTNRENYRSSNKVKDHHFWIPFDYWKSSHKRYFFYIYELMKNKNKKVENVPFKLKSIIFSDYVMCSVSVEVYEIIYKDNQEFHLDVLSDCGYDTAGAEASTGEGTSEDQSESVEPSGERSGKQGAKGSKKKHSGNQRHYQCNNPKECTEVDESNEDYTRNEEPKGEGLPEDESFHRNSSVERNLKSGTPNGRDSNAPLKGRGSSDYSDEIIHHRASVKKGNGNIYGMYKKPGGRKLSEDNIPYDESDTPSGLIVPKGDLTANSIFIGRNYEPTACVRNKLKKTSSCYRLRNGSNGFRDSCEEASLNTTNRSHLSNSANSFSGSNYERSLQGKLGEADGRGTNSHRFHVRSGKGPITHKIRQHGGKYYSPRSLSSVSPEPTSIDHVYSYKNEGIPDSDNIQRGRSKGKITTNAQVKRKSCTFFPQKKVSSSEELHEPLSSVMNKPTCDVSNVGEAEHKKDSTWKEKKIYEFLRKNRKRNQKKGEDRNKGVSSEKSGYEYFLKCNNLSYNIVSSYEKNKKKYVTIDFTHDPEGNTKEHIICGDVLILIGHKNIEKFHKGFSSSYSFHTGFLKKASSEILHIRKEDMDINSNYQSYIPDGMKLSIILDSANRSDCMKAYKRNLRGHNKMEDLKSLKIFEKNKSFESIDSERAVYDLQASITAISAPDGGRHNRGETGVRDKGRRRTKGEREDDSNEEEEEGKSRWWKERSAHNVVNCRRERMATVDDDEEEDDDDEECIEQRCEQHSDKEHEPNGPSHHMGETRQTSQKRRERVRYTSPEHRDPRNKSNCSNSKQMDSHSKINYSGYSIFNKKEPKIKYNATNITQLLTSLFGFKNREDKYSLTNKQSVCSLLSSKRSFSNLISLKDFLQRQYEVITNPTESMYNFVKNHVLKVNIPLVQYLKKITHLSNLKIYFSLKLCNNDLSKSLNFIVSIWGIKILKKKSSIRYSSTLNELPEFREEFKEIVPHDVDIKTPTEIARHVNDVDSTNVSCTHVDVYEKLEDSANLFKEHEQVPAGKDAEVVLSKEPCRKVSSLHRLEETFEWTKDPGDVLHLKELHPYRESEAVSSTSVARGEETSEVKIGTQKEVTPSEPNEVSDQNKLKEPSTQKMQNEGPSEVITNIDGIKIAKMEINKTYYQMREETNFAKSKEEPDLRKNEKEMVQEHPKKTIEDNESFLNSMMEKDEPSKGIEQTNTKNDILKKIEGNDFFYGKLPSGELVKIKVNDTNELGTYDSMPLLLIEPVDDSGHLKRAMSGLSVKEESDKNENATLEKAANTDCLVNDLEKMYDQKVIKKSSIESTLSVESDRSTMSRYSTSLVVPPPASISKGELPAGKNVEVKIDQKIDAKINQQVDPKVEQKADTKVDEKMDPKVEQKADTKVDPGVVVKPPALATKQMTKQPATEGQTKAKAVEAILRKAKEKRPPPPLPSALQKRPPAKATTEGKEPGGDTKKESSVKPGVPKKMGKKMPGPPPKPPFALGKGIMGEKTKMGMKKCPMNFAPKKFVKVQEKRPLGIKLHWQLLPTHKIEGTVFNEIKTQEAKYTLIDTKAVHKLFARVKAEKKIVKKSTEEKKKSNEEKLITVLDRTRAQNIGILLRFPMSTQEIVQKISVFDLENMSTEFLQKVLHILPTKEESDSILQKLEHENVKEEHFRDVERKLIPFVYMDKCQCKIEICLFSLKYEKMINEINKDLDVYDEAVKEVRSSIRLRSLLKAVLKWGNYVNYGVNDNEDLVALGFTLSSVLKLTEFKSSIDNTITSLHYITVSLCTYLPNLNMNLLENDLNSVSVASKMSSETVDILLASIDKDINYIGEQLKCTYEEVFKEKMKSILQDSEMKYANAQKRYEETKKSVQQLGTYLGEDMSKSPNLEGIFIVLSSIVDNFTKCYKDILANPKKFSIMLNDENLLDEYYTFFGKKKNKNLPSSKNCTPISKEAVTKEQGATKESEKITGKIRINRLNSCMGVVRKNDNAKSSMFQLRTKLMQDIQNRAFIKVGNSDGDKVKCEPTIPLCNQKDTPIPNIALGKNDMRVESAQGLSENGNCVDTKGATVPHGCVLGGESKSRKNSAGSVNETRLEPKKPIGSVNETRLGVDNSLGSVNNKTRLREGLNCDEKPNGDMAAEVKLTESPKIESKPNVSTKIEDKINDEISGLVAEEKIVE
ncbi:hypothetical protein AK88_03142 [Plasmodium fragile]|uniref:FH2 domain-containing protein n=1 Tax=Plasmodium fragile TaxID=5857 RepID=A0A0D9QJJ0_PLAFR|nr:uncharacterized protein AK88_03142 [Plasmodium fragile]KJP87225.1 hypothetical protein AK88_03142 [Plasmodium fragile]